MSHSSSSPTLDLLASAFGPGTTLYGALGSSRDASAADLKKSYRALALLYHPDKQQTRRQTQNQSQTKRQQATQGEPCEGGVSLEQATLRFQAVSAAYEVLMDPERRAEYDATGTVAGETFSSDSGNGAGAPRHHRSSRDRQQRRWDGFFRSVFSELATAGDKHGDGESYRGSEEEARDVLSFYVLCKGDLARVLECVVHGEKGDLPRWKEEIVGPAVARGEVPDYGAAAGGRNQTKNKRANRTGPGSGGAASGPAKPARRRFSKPKRKTIASRCLEDSSDEDDDGGGRRFRSRKTPTAVSTGLCDTEDEEEDEDGTETAGAAPPTRTPPPMNKRDKMEYRVAKKRKLKALREMEVSRALRSKSWGGGVAAAAAAAGRGKRRSAPVVAEAVLARMEGRYAPGGASSGKRSHSKSKKPLRRNKK
ncbi:unnamed protein product [Pseudo-nitzschia multistriata]|uniref:J domain-containing protein n=1 Tax=Pseudo-nitzschia multistriata TaxID=183589 RepID=A0A448Z284_9STRA|nr:unnamed protein product [Pseudo-nitzschia multistriata]